MKLTLFDYVNLIILGISTLLVGATQLLQWSSSYMVFMMTILVVMVLMNSILNRKYRKKTMPMSESDRKIAIVTMVVTIIFVILLLLFPQLR